MYIHKTTPPSIYRGESNIYSDFVLQNNLTDPSTKECHLNNAQHKQVISNYLFKETLAENLNHSLFCDTTI